MKRLHVIIIALSALCFGLLPTLGQAALGDIVTVAGGAGGGVGDNGAATASKLLYPPGVAVDNLGNLFIADQGDNRIRKVAAGTGIITTVAGTGAGGHSGDGGAATAATLYGPTAVAVDRAGNLYIADQFNNRIRMVSGAGIISTVAGNGTAAYSGDSGAATAASLSAPSGLAVDGTGNLYIADSGNNRVRMVSAGSGIITTVAGTGTAGFSGDNAAATGARLSAPTGVALDSAGNLYIADTNNNRVRLLAAGTGIITTVAGNGTAGLSGDGGAATAASLSNPTAVAVDGAGDMFIADRSNDCVREVLAVVGTITTVAGNGKVAIPSLRHPSGVAVDGSGNLYIADQANYLIRKLSAGSGSVVAGGGSWGFSGDNGAATAAMLNAATGVAVDSAGNLYIADQANNRVREVVAATGTIITVAGNGTAAFSGDSGAATAASLSFPEGMAPDGSGNLFIADKGNNRIRMVAAGTGVITTVAGNGSAAYSGDNGAATAAGLGSPSGVALDSAGNLYLADTGNHRIRKVSAGAGIITTVAGNGTGGYSGDSGAAIAASLSSPRGVALDASGNLYIADTGNNRIRKVAAATGIITTVVGNGFWDFAGDNGAATAASITYPTGVAVDSAGNIYVADVFNLRIRKVSGATGIISTVAGNGFWDFAGDNGAASAASISYPTGVAVDSAGNLYIADKGNNRVRQVSQAVSPPPVLYTIAASAGSGGSINPAGSVVVSQGASQSFAIAPNAGQQIAGVTVDGASAGAVSSYTFSNVAANHTIAATFSASTASFSITASAGSGGTISPAGTTTVISGGSKTYTVSPNAGFKTAGVTVDGVSVGAVASYTFSNVTANHAIAATFSASAGTFAIVASATTGGSITPAGTATLASGASQTYAIAPNTGSYLASVSVDGVVVASNLGNYSYTFTNVTANHTIAATFATATYTVTASAGPNGTVSPTGTTYFNFGTNATYTITPAAGNAITDVKVDGASVGAVPSYTFIALTANHTIAATFALKPSTGFTITASAGTGGSIFPAGATIVTQGASQAYGITPNTGFHVAGVTVDGTAVGAVSSYTFSSVAANHTIAATFSANTISANIPHTGWLLQFADSQELTGENGAATNAFDGQTTTIWHTQWLTANPPCPHEIQINLGKSYSIDSFSYLPRQDGSPNGTIAGYEFYVSSDGVNWGTAVATGTFANTTALKQVPFSAKSGQYIRLRALSEINGNPWTSAAEINVTGR